jgi:hypothetical protein
MFIMLTSGNRVFKPKSGKIKDYKIGICCFFAHAAVRSMSRLAGSESDTYDDVQSVFGIS